jgi:cytochrome c oxidase subunit 4
VESTARRQATARTYLTVWASLLALTALTVTLASVGLGRFTIATVLVIAASKTSIIAAWFMHLRYEKIHLYVAFVLIALATLAVFTALTATDVASR